MEAEPKSVDLFIKQLKEELGVQASIIEQSAVVAKILIDSASLLIKFYNSLHFNVKHVEEPFRGLRQIHIDEDLFLERNKVIMARLGAALGLAHRIYARSTNLVRINKEEALSFQKEHHLQVPLPGKYRYGLLCGEVLMAIAVFSGGRKMRDTAPEYRSFELLRCCNRSGYLVVGGLSKLLKGLVNAYQPGDIMTYIDRDWSSGANYEKLGFRSEGFVPPQHFMVNVTDHIRYHVGRADQPMDPSVSRFWVENLGSIKMRQVL